MNVTKKRGHKQSGKEGAVQGDQIVYKKWILVDVGKIET